VLSLYNKVSSFHLLDENFATIHFSMLFGRSNPLNIVFIRKIDQLLSGGLLLKHNNYEIFYHPSQQEEEQVPKKLTMDHLGICFVAVTVCLGLSCIAFMIELLRAYIVKQVGSSPREN
jgi:hypothetical protein